MAKINLSLRKYYWYENGLGETVCIKDNNIENLKEMWILVSSSGSEKFDHILHTISIYVQSKCYSIP